MKLIVLSYPDLLENEARNVTNMMEAGLDCFHVRKPTWNKEQVKAFLEEIPQSFHSKIVIHSQHELAKQYDLKGIHWTTRHRQDPNTAQGVQPVSTSFHEIDELVVTKRSYEYCFLSPIYNSISKTNYPSKFSKKVLQSVLLQVPLQVVALGGITPDKIEECKQLGFDGVASLGAIWQSSNPLEKFYQFQRIVKLQ